MNTIPYCRHCRRLPGTESRGLCWRCYRRVEIRVLYPRVAKSCKGERCNDYGGEMSTVPTWPVRAIPGTEAKIRVLEERAAKRQPLFHHDDLHYSQVPDEEPTD